MGIRVLSLFDGISCGRIALERAGIEVDEYVSFEIDPYAIKVSQKNYPDIKQCGDVTTADFTKYNGFDLVIGGSPCQDMSSARKGEGLEGEKSGLFFEFVRAIKEVNPKYFLLENVVPKQKKDEDTITEYMGVKPQYINSSDFSAQNRPRLYWTNIPIDMNYEKNQLNVIDILKDKNDFHDNYPKWLLNKWGKKTRLDQLFDCYGKASCLTAAMYKGQKASFTKNKDNLIHKFTPEECEILQTLPEGYTNCVSDTQRYKSIGNGWTVDVIAHIFKGLSKNI